jgi:tetratricopeptide (TPR) repeat protein
MIGAGDRLFFLSALALVFIAPGSAHGVLGPDHWPGLEPGPHAVGVRVHHVYDHGRSFESTRGGEDGSAPEVGSRPLQIVVWYPAEPAVDSARMESWEYARLRFTQFDFDRVGDVSKQEVVESLLVGVREDGSDPTPVEDLLAAETLGVRDAEPAEGRFPLLIYGAGGESSAWDNFVLCEYLASQGYVVAATSSFGKSSSRMTYDFEGLESVTRDHEFVLAFLWDVPPVDPTRVGSLGWSTGALSAAKLAMRNARVAAVAALDGSMGYTTYRGAAEQSPDYDYDRLTVPFMYLSQRPTANKDLGFLDDFSHANVYLARFADLIHSDFGAVAILVDVHARGERADRDRETVERGYAAVCRYVRAFFDTHLKGSEAAGRFLLRTPEENGIAAGVLTFEPRVVSARRWSKEEFMELVRSGNVDRAIEVHERMLALDPDVVLFDEFRLGMEAMRFLRMGEAETALELLELIAGSTREATWQLCDALAMARLAVGRTEEAVASFNRSLALRPDNPTARAALDAGDGLDELSSPAYLKSFTGKYAGDNWTAVVTVEDDRLRFKVPGEQKDWLIPVGKDRFLLAGVFGCSVEFADDELIFHIPSGAVRMKRGEAG